MVHLARSVIDTSGRDYLSLASEFTFKSVYKLVSLALDMLDIAIVVQDKDMTLKHLSFKG